MSQQELLSQVRKKYKISSKIEAVVIKQFRSFEQCASSIMLNVAMSFIAANTKIPLFAIHEKCKNFCNIAAKLSQLRQLRYVVLKNFQTLENSDEQYAMIIIPASKKYAEPVYDYVKKCGITIPIHVVFREKDDEKYFCHPMACADINIDNKYYQIYVSEFYIAYNLWDIFPY